MSRLLSGWDLIQLVLLVAIWLIKEEQPFCGRLWYPGPQPTPEKWSPLEGCWALIISPPARRNPHGFLTLRCITVFRPDNHQTTQPTNTTSLHKRSRVSWRIAADWFLEKWIPLGVGKEIAQTFPPSRGLQEPHAVRGTPQQVNYFYFRRVLR